MDDEDDVHLCLTCNKTIAGLINYVNHKKNECAGKKAQKKPETAAFLPSTAVCTPSATSTETLTSTVTQSFDSAFFLDSSYSNVQPGGLTTGGLLSDQTTFLSASGLSSPNGGFHTPSFPETGDFNKILSTTENSHTRGDLIGLSGFSNNQSSDSTQPKYSLSPILSTTRNGADVSSSIDALSSLSSTLASSEDHGIMSAIISNKGLLESKRKRNRSKHSMPVTYDDETESHGFEKKSGKEEVIDDFFQSLELMSKTDPRAEKGSSFNQLPISNILNNLTFSSDEEDLSFSFAEDVSFDSLTDESDDDLAPPRHHTGGKWKPGEKPTAYKKNSRQYSQGKWPPGQAPLPGPSARRQGPSSHGKNIALIRRLESENKAKSRGRKAKKATNATGQKLLTCTFCNISFDNRFKYSNHCRSSTHKANVFGTPVTASDNSSHDFVDKTVELSDTSIQNTSINENKDQSAEPVSQPVVKDGNTENETAEDDGTASEKKDTEEPEEADVSELNEDNEHTDEEIVSESEGVVDEPEEAGNGNSHEIEEKADESLEPDTGEHNNESDSPETLLPVHVCTVCDKKYPNKLMIAKHLLTKYHKNRAAANLEEHFKLLEKYNKCLMKFSPFQCSICKFYYNKYDEFKAHVHSENHAQKCSKLLGEMQCTLCKFKSHNQKAVLNHFDSSEHVTAVMSLKKICILKECHVKSECKFCGLEMRSYTRLMRHVHLKHADEQIVEKAKKIVKGVRNRPCCPHCNKRFESESALSLHIARRHTFERKYTCEVCEKSFADKYTLLLHNKSYAHNNKLAAFDYTKSKEDGKAAERTDKSETSKNKASEDHESDQNADTEKGDEKAVEESKDVDKAASVDVQAKIPDDNEIKEADGSETEGLDDDDFLVVQQTETKPRKKKNPPKRPPRKTIKCDHCSFTVTKYDDLRPHYMEKHSSQIRICEVCDVVLLSDKGFKLHWNSALHQKNIKANMKGGDEKLFECQICKKKYADENYRNFHTAYQHLHATTDAAAIKANGGSITLEKYKDLLKEIDPLPFSERIKCPDCDTLVKKMNIHVHLRTHTDEKLFRCKMCSKGFIASYTLRKHLLQHFGCTDRTCDICGKDFKKISAFQKHMSVHRAEANSDGKTFICETCGISFFLEAQLKRHMTRHMEKKFKCTHPGCHWKFVMIGELNAHMRCHDEERKYLCDTCGYSAHTPYHLKRHYKVHTGERKFHCEYCTYKAGNNTHLQRHMRIHIGSKPFKCPYCSYACNTHENIRKHILETKKHVGKKMYPCKFCDYGTNSSKEFRAHLVTEHEDVIGKDFKEPALTAFTGVYSREEDPKQPLEGTKIIPLKERKNTRRKGDKTDMDDDSGSDIKNVDTSLNKRKGQKRKRKPDVPEQSESQEDLYPFAKQKCEDEFSNDNTYNVIKIDPSNFTPEQETTSVSLIMNKTMKHFAPVGPSYNLNRIRPVPDEQQDISQLPVGLNLVYPNQQHYYQAANQNMLETLINSPGLPKQACDPNMQYNN